LKLGAKPFIEPFMRNEGFGERRVSSFFSNDLLRLTGLPVSLFSLQNGETRGSRATASESRCFLYGRALPVTRFGSSAGFRSPRQTKADCGRLRPMALDAPWRLTQIAEFDYSE
jgi:hypothetical protein